MARSAAWFTLGLGVVVACSSVDDRELATQTLSTPLRAVDYVGAGLANKELVLTFDDGPGARTAELSTYLKAEGIHATFFVNGKNFTGATNTLLAQLVADGHLIGNHTQSHMDLVTEVTTKAARVSEVNTTDALIASFIPWNKFLFRPPYGSWSAGVAADLGGASSKYIGPINWDIGGFSDEYPSKAADWACWQGQLYAGASKANGTGYATTKQCGDAYLSEIVAVGRGIVLMHDPYSWAQGNTVDMVKYLVPLLKADGFTFKAIDQVPSIAADIKPCDVSCATCTGPAATDCATCPAGKYVKAGACTACTTCATGTYEATACAANADTVCASCDPSCSACSGSATSCACPPGQFAASSGCQPCSSCAPGTFASAACTASADTTCTACGDCDDHDACTDDTCDGAKGCVHTPKPGCTGGSAPATGDAPTDSMTASASGCSMGRGSSDSLLGVVLALGLVSARRRRR